MITSLKLKNFTAFNDLEIEFSPKINVIIGENGTGKTQLLKAAYAMLSDCSATDQATIEQSLTQKIIRLFKPMDQKLGKMWRRGSNKDKASLEIKFVDGTIIADFNYNSQDIALTQTKNYELHPIFIPTKEVLSLVKGISSADNALETVELIFDDTYIDLCKSLLEPMVGTIEKKMAHPRFGTVYPKLVDAIEGRYELEDGDFIFHSGCYLERKKRLDAKHAAFYSDATEHVFKANGQDNLSACMTAEGFRKIGIIQHLLANEALSPKKCGVLFWDEPEANLNPKLMRMIVESLLELSRNGLQIIIATHDYTTLKWFDLLKNSGKDDHICYHSLYRDEEHNEVMLNSTDNYLAIKPNSIADVFSDLTDNEISKTMGRLGK